MFHNFTHSHFFGNNLSHNGAEFDGKRVGLLLKQAVAVLRSLKSGFHNGQVHPRREDHNFITARHVATFLVFRSEQSLYLNRVGVKRKFIFICRRNFFFLFLNFCFGGIFSLVEVNNEDDSCYPDDHVIQLQFFVGLPYAERTMSVTQNQTSSSLSPLSTYFEELFCY